MNTKKKSFETFYSRNKYFAHNSFIFFDIFTIFAKLSTRKYPRNVRNIHCFHVDQTMREMREDNYWIYT